ncbi:unnamed protein product [Didymodactylos carnosus]|uniref:Uncharacterized protein n=1 Tax=Didymodactylos carnosus TaxID=1234261 RepID=A0A815XI66_9BILA|nr:unnamed protein product [Didymodactylos carnosus]CAF4419173.1 unnamed protein product [Didymodactylos carnosus]
MKSVLLVLVFAVACSGQLTTDFLENNILKPLLDDIYNNAIGMLGQQLTQLLGSLFGKRSAVERIDIFQILAPYIEQVKAIYKQLFSKFEQIVQHIASYVNKPDFARIEFVYAGIDAEQQLARLSLPSNIFGPILALVQQHLSAAVTQLENALGSIFQTLQPTIGTGNLLP